MEYPGNTVPQNADDLELTAKKILAGLDGGTWTNGGSSGGSGTPTTPHSSIVTGAGSIPIGAKGYTFTVLTGTATFNGATGLPVGFSDNSPNTTAAAIAYDASGGSAYVRYDT